MNDKTNEFNEELARIASGLNELREKQDAFTSEDWKSIWQYEKDINNIVGMMKMALNDPDLKEDEALIKVYINQADINLRKFQTNLVIDARAAARLKEEPKKIIGETEEEQALNDILRDPTATPEEKEAAKKEFELSQSRGLSMQNGGKPTGKYTGVPPKHATEEEKERYNLSRDGKYKVDIGNGKSTFYEKRNETLNYKSLKDDAADRKVIEKMIDHALKLGYNPPTLSGEQRLVKMAQEILKAKGIDYSSGLGIGAPKR